MLGLVPGTLIGTSILTLLPHSNRYLNLTISQPFHSENFLLQLCDKGGCDGCLNWSGVGYRQSGTQNFLEHFGTYMHFWKIIIFWTFSQDPFSDPIFFALWVIHFPFFFILWSLSEQYRLFIHKSFSTNTTGCFISRRTIIRCTGQQMQLININLHWLQVKKY